MSRGHDETVTVFLGDLSRDVTKEDIEKEFGYYGKLKSVWLSRSPSGFGFIDFEDHLDAADAVKALDGKMICGSRVRVEFSHGRGRSTRGGGGSSSGGGGGGGGSARGARGRSGSGGRSGRSGSGGGGGRSRRGSGSRSPRSRKPFSSQDVCYECGERGHYAYDCEIRLRRQRRGKSSSRSRSPKRSSNGQPSKRAPERRSEKQRSRSRSSRSGSGRDHSYSRSRSSSGSASPVRPKERRSSPIR